MIRLATLEDAQDILNIYSYYVTDTAITYEYEIPSLKEFKERMQQIMSFYPYLVYLEDNKIVGYAYVSKFHERKAYEWCVESSIYIDKDYKQKGIGKQLYDALEMICKEMNIKNLNACIACTEIEDEYLTNDSIRFHEKLGYTPVGTFHQCAYKFNRWYDMIWMEKSIGLHSTNESEIVNFNSIKEKFCF